MSTSDHDIEKPHMKSELDNEGTSARTRPFSYEDVMLRRKNKIAAQAAFSGGSNKEHHNETASEERDIIEDSRRASGVSSKRKERNIHGVDERKINKDRSREKRKLEARSNSTLRRDHNRDAAHRGKSDRYDDDRKRSNRADEDFRNESRQTRLGHLNSRVIFGGKPNGRYVKERVFKQGAYSDHKQSYRRIDADQSRYDRKMEPNRKDLRASGRMNRFADRGGIVSDKHASRELSGRNEKDSLKFDHEEISMKRKRSGSREHYKDKSRRSASLSPRAQKRKSLADQHKSSNEKFQKPHIDSERRKRTSNSSNANQRRYGSSSGLGGYSPRKRKTEAGASTPSPPHRSPGRRTAGWDHLATIKDSNIKSNIVSDVQTAMQNDPKPPSLSDISVTVKPDVSQYAPSPQMHTTDLVHLTLATRPMRSLYVESLPSSASEKDVLESVNSFLLSSGVNRIIGSLPCISCMINKEKNQALLEFLTPEDASAALSMDGRMFSGSILKIRRPKDYVEPITGVPDEPVDEDHVISDKIEDSSHMIFIGGISKLLSSEMIVKIAGAFGSLKAFRLELNQGSDVHYAFIEYVDHLVTQKACAGLNGMKLGGRVITVVRATGDAPSLGDDGLRCLYGIPENAKPLLKPPTRVLKLQNVFGSEGISLLSEPELEDTLEDIKLECTRFGAVKGVNVVKHIKDSTIGNDSDASHKHGLDEMRKGSSTEDVQVEETELGKEPVGNELDYEACEATLGDRDLANMSPDKATEQGLDREPCFEVGSVLVEFKREEASCMAAHCLHGRYFDERVVCVEYVDPDLYHKKFSSKA